MKYLSKKSNVIFYIAVLIGIAFNYPEIALSSSGIKNQKAPPWGVTKWSQLPEGKTKLDIDDYKGKVLYLYGFQSWCPGCHKYGFPTLQKLVSHYSNNPNIQFVAIQTAFEGFFANTFEKARETMNKFKLSIPVGQSGEKNSPSIFMKRYKTRGTPWTIIIDKNGIVHYNDFHIQPGQAIELIDQLENAE